MSRVLLIVAALLLSLYLFKSSHEDLVTYEAMHEKKMYSNKSDQLNMSMQHRWGVEKDFWISDAKERSHFHIQSARSTLYPSLKKGHIDLIEKLEGVTAFRRSLENNQEELRCFYTTSATYLLLEQKLIANQADIAFFGYANFDIPYFIGSASKLIFSGETMRVEAENLKASLNRNL